MSIPTVWKPWMWCLCKGSDTRGIVEMVSEDAVQKQSFINFIYYVAIVIA